MSEKPQTDAQSLQPMQLSQIPARRGNTMHMAVRADPIARIDVGVQAAALLKKLADRTQGPDAVVAALEVTIADNRGTILLRRSDAITDDTIHVAWNARRNRCGFDLIKVLQELDLEVVSGTHRFFPVKLDDRPGWSPCLALSVTGSWVVNKTVLGTRKGNQRKLHYRRGESADSAQRARRQAEAEAEPAAAKRPPHEP